MKLLKKVRSKEDQSVNLILGDQFNSQKVESRLVFRQEKAIFYVSSHYGCKQACAFCHLTATKQTKQISLTASEVNRQIESLFVVYNNSYSGKKVGHLNFMSQGDFFTNPYLERDFQTVADSFIKLCRENLMFPKINISTIFPKSFRSSSLIDVFRTSFPTIYYSLYSLEDGFRKKWIPNSLSVSEAISLLKEYQQKTKKIVKIHYPLISGENDTVEQAKAIGQSFTRSGLICQFNILAYNPPNDSSKESTPETIQEYVDALQEFFPVKTIPRVGYDVNASCGMFYTSEQVFSKEEQE